MGTGQAMKVLVVEDDRLLSHGVQVALEQRGFHVQACGNGIEALQRLRGDAPDAVLLDIGLPGLDGLAVLGRLRLAKCRIPVLVMTARSGVGDRIQALNAGADDYLCKPFDLDELEARLRALLRRAQGGRPTHQQCGELCLELESGVFYLGTRILELSPREQAFLRPLIAKAGEVVPKDRLFRAVFALDGDVLPQALDVVAHRVRRKLAGAGVELVTVRGLGYLLREPAAAFASTR
jgi:two-component system response regulator TctD